MEMFNDTYIRKTMSIPGPLSPMDLTETVEGSAEHEAAVRATLAERMAKIFWLSASPNGEIAPVPRHTV